MRPGFLALVLCMLLSACGSEPLRSWPEIRGRVLDAETEEPIGGAHVIVYAQGDISVFVDTQRVCYHIDAAVTDSDGRFEIPTWNEGFSYSSASGKHQDVSVFKAGYSEAMRTYRERSYRKNIWYQQKFHGTRAEWLERLKAALSSTACGSAGKMEARVLPMLAAVLSAAQRLGEGEEEKKFQNRLISVMGQIRKYAGN